MSSVSTLAPMAGAALSSLAWLFILRRRVAAAYRRGTVVGARDGRAYQLGLDIKFVRRFGHLNLSSYSEHLR